MTYREISKCRICGNSELTPVLDLGQQALTGIFPKSMSEQVPVAPLELVKCNDENSRTCGLVQLRHSCELSSMYGLNYGYRSGLNQSMVRHLQNKAQTIKQNVSLGPGDIVLDIGSNDGTFLRAMQEPGAQLVGMDPTGIKFRQYYPDHVNLIPDFFSAELFRREYGSKRAKVVTSIAMFYDLESPMSFMDEIRQILANDGIWIFEQSYLPVMLAETSYDTICHEHLEYYSLKQIIWMAERNGLEVLDVEENAVNGGSFSVTAGIKGGAYHPNNAAISQLVQREIELGLHLPQPYALFRDKTFQHRDELQHFFLESKKIGYNVIGYGASTKGNVILQFCGVTPNELSCIAEVNTDKYGAFTPGTLIPIISEEEAYSRKPDGFLVLPWHFRDFILEKEKARLETGIDFIFPLPQIEVVENAKSIDRRL